MNVIVYMVGLVMVFIALLLEHQMAIVLMTFAKRLNVNLVLLVMVIIVVITMNVHGHRIQSKNTDFIIQMRNARRAPHISVFGMPSVLILGAVIPVNVILVMN